MKKETFDNIIKKNLIDVTGIDNFGYKLTRTYSNYYNKSAFAVFLTEMKNPPYESYYWSYASGKGSELKEQDGRYGKLPPKMASVASSSRFCYLALRDGADALGCKGSVEFEKACEIEGIDGIAPQLDAYIPEKNIYIEAKCHEIFDSHKVILKEKYWNLFYGLDNDFGFEVREKEKEETFSIPFSVFGISKTSTRFDVKQLLCHLLGIASKKEYQDSATLLYLFFKPRTTNIDQQKQIDEIFKELTDEIDMIFHSEPIHHFISKHHITLRAVAEYAEIMEPLSQKNLIVLVRN